MNSMEIYDYLLDNLELPDDENTQAIADEIYFRLDYLPMYEQIEKLATELYKEEKYVQKSKCR